MIQLIDSFNSVIISSHRTLTTAVRASRAHDRAVKRNNGESSYIPYSFRNSDGSRIDPDEVMAVKMDLDQAR